MVGIILVLALMLLPVFIILRGIADITADNGPALLITLFVIGLAIWTYFALRPDETTRAIAKCNEYQPWTNMSKERFDTFCKCEAPLFVSVGRDWSDEPDAPAGRQFTRWGISVCFNVFKPEGLKRYKPASN
jgi:hypothetical protein